jgi:hypothetical protein
VSADGQDTLEHPASPLAGIRERLAEKRVAVTQDVPLPEALEDELAVRYQPLPYEKAEQIRGRNDKALDAAMDVLINACRCILYRVGDKWEPLEQDGKLVRFDRRLAAALGIPDGAEGGQAVDTRLILRGVFALAAGGKSPEHEDWPAALVRADHLINMTNTVYSVWLGGGGNLGVEQELLDEEALGESEGDLR